MSTRGYIFVKVSKKDQGKSLKFDREMIKKSGVTLHDSNKWNGKGFDELTDDIFRETPNVWANYIGIYIGADAYPTGAGEALLKHFDSYREAMNLMAGGMASSVYGDRVNYNQESRQWHYDHPEQQHPQDPDPGVMPIQKMLPEYCDSFQYVYNNNQWWVRKYNTYFYNLHELMELAKRENIDIDNAFGEAAEVTDEYKELEKYPSWTKRTEEQTKAYDKDVLYAGWKWNIMEPTPENVRHLDIDKAREVLKKYETVA